MITIITRVIIVQMDKFLKNSFNFLFVERKFGKIKNNTAIRKIADIISFITIIYQGFFQNFFAFSKKLLIMGLDFSDSIFLNSSKSSFCFEFKLDGTSVIIFI